VIKLEIKKLDKLWSQKIRERDEVCQVCGNSQYLNAHHVIGRRNRNIRWDLDNGITLCSGCHTFKTESAHQDPAWFMEWFIKKYPERYNNIMIKRIITNKQLYTDVIGGLE